MESRTPRSVERKAPPVLALIVTALAESGRPLRPREIHRAVQQGAERTVPRSTVIDCLVKNAGTADSGLVRIAHGLYGLTATHD